VDSHQTLQAVSEHQWEHQLEHLIMADSHLHHHNDNELGGDLFPSFLSRKKRE
jgi:hypothetical protein